MLNNFPNDSAFKGYIVVDLEGTLTDISHRVHLAQSKLWDDFQALSDDDKIIEATGQIVSALSDYFSVIIVTGRNEKFRTKTEDWLEAKDYSRFVSEILMRADDDYRPDAEVKIALLEERFGSKEKVLANVQLCLDDRDRVVEAFRNYGLTCWQVREGDY